MTSSVVMVTVSERLASLNNFLESMAKYQPQHDVILHMQGEDVRDQIKWPAGIEYTTMYTEERLGCHAARVRLLNTLGDGYDSYVNVDDDVELLPETNWEAAIEKAHEPGVGFVLTGWARHQNALVKARSIIREEFLPQVFVYQGGGMAYTADLAELMKTLPDTPARYDDIWPLTSYLTGHKNYRYRGSLALHRTLQRGGMQSYMRAEPRPLLCTQWVNYRFLPSQKVGDDYAIPMDSDLKPIARQVHLEARRARGW
jgi:hypothetical protein